MSCHKASVIFVICNVHTTVPYTQIQILYFFSESFISYAAFYYFYLSFVLFQPMDCQANPTEANSYTEGCFKKAVAFVEEHALIIGGVGIAVALIMVSKVLTH